MAAVSEFVRSFIFLLFTVWIFSYGSRWLFLMAILPLTLMLFYWCHVSDSLGMMELWANFDFMILFIFLSIALTSFTYLALFNIGV